jgi:hypothetical protein
MEWPIIVAVVVGIPIILFPAALAWFINVSGILSVMKETRKREIARKRTAMAAETAKS